MRYGTEGNTILDTGWLHTLPTNSFSVFYFIFDRRPCTFDISQQTEKNEVVLFYLIQL